MFYKFFKFLKLYLKSGNGGRGQKIFLKKKKFFKRNFGNGGRGGSIYFFFDKFLKNNFNYYLNNNKFFSENGKNAYKIFKNGKNGKNILLRIPHRYKIFNFENNNFINFKNKKTINLALEGGVGQKSFIYSDTNIKDMNYNNFGVYKYYYLINNFYFNFCLIGLTNTGKSSFISNLFRKHIKVSNYFYTTLEKAFFYIKICNKEISILDNSGFLKNYCFYNILEFKIYYKWSKIFFHFLNFFFIFNIIFNFKTFNNKIYIYNKIIFYKPRFLIFNKIDLISKFKNVIIFRLKNFLNWYNFLFFNTFYYKNFYIFKKFF
ncbi:GTPase domain-containing protein [Candidatus Nasuia deltocephalinicola]|uniref:GTPase domain-containing protein n=1 Tax=Candidatus Nasuia deltocephalincola TaxID=1160784 RepID=UPI00216B042C|nr:GTPase domain-containing protein [Candidatus Nasuia deltocephalinicola]